MLCLDFEAELVAEEQAAEHQVAVAGLPLVVHALLAEAADAHGVVVANGLRELLGRHGHRVVDGHHEAAAEDHERADDLVWLEGACIAAAARAISTVGTSGRTTSSRTATSPTSPRCR